METVEDMIRALAHVGVKLTSVFADVGELRGRMTCRRVRGFDYAGFDHPWDHLKWFHSGCGRGNMRGNGTCDFTIDVGQLPKPLAKEVEKMFDALTRTQGVAEEVRDHCRTLAEKAREQVYTAEALRMGLARLQENANAMYREITITFCKPRDVTKGSG